MAVVYLLSNVLRIHELGISLKLLHYGWRRNLQRSRMNLGRLCLYGRLKYTVLKQLEKVRLGYIPLAALKTAWR